MIKTTFGRFPTFCLATGVSLVLTAAPVSADIPDNLTDLVYQDAGWSAGQLRSRGYTRVDWQHHDGYNMEYWWNSRAHTCVRAKETDRRYEALVTTSNADCNQYHKEARDNDKATAIAVGAAALIGAAILAHKSHERDGKHDQDEKSVAEFDRGYRDGLHHERYHNYNNTTAYSDGYNAGQRKRDVETSHRAYDGHHSGYHAYVAVDDLVGARAAGADSELRSRGFRDTGGYKQDGKSIVTWYNANTRQCVKVVTKDGHIKRLQSIAEGNCT